MFRNLVLVGSLVACAAGAGCTRQGTSETAAKGNAPVLKIAVYANGRIAADGVTTTIEDLRESLKRLADKNGIVWYYREAARAEPPPQAMLVMDAVIGARLPIRLSTKPDYSDAIGSDGRPIQK